MGLFAGVAPSDLGKSARIQKNDYPFWTRRLPTRSLPPMSNGPHVAAQEAITFDWLSHCHTCCTYTLGCCRDPAVLGLLPFLASTPYCFRRLVSFARSVPFSTLFTSKGLICHITFAMSLLARSLPLLSLSCRSSWGSVRESTWQLAFSLLAPSILLFYVGEL